MQHLITIEELKTLGRPIGKVADEKLNAFITEAEQLHVKPILGDELFLELLHTTGDQKKDILLHGGEYQTKKGTRTFMGLKSALSYFVYAQNIMTGDIESTRYGTVIKSGDYSEHISSKERSEAYNNALDVANTYLQECVDYCREVGLIKTAGKSRASFGGITIRKIG